MVDVPTSLNDLKTKVDDLDVCKLKNVNVDLKKLNDAVIKLLKTQTHQTKYKSK